MFQGTNLIGTETDVGMSEEEERRRLCDNFAPFARRRVLKAAMKKGMSNSLWFCEHRCHVHDLLLSPSVDAGQPGQPGGDPAAGDDPGKHVLGVEIVFKCTFLKKETLPV